jgi:hypothetical protein
LLIIFTNKLKLGTKPVVSQQAVFNQLIQEAKDTAFGKDHRFDSIKTFADFAVPVRDYEDLKPYVDKVVGTGKHSLERKTTVFC